MRSPSEHEHLLAIKTRCYEFSMGSQDEPSSTPPNPTSNTISDVFSDSPPTSPSLAPHATEPSDIPRLRTLHSTAGYREAVSVSKEKHLQSGFDEGYSLGATFGLRIGSLLGILEGLATASKDGTERDLPERQRVLKLLGEARKELCLESVFAKTWWNDDGTWKYEVTGDEASVRDLEDAVTFEQVVEVHPLVVRWSSLVQREREIAGLRCIFQGEDWEKGRLDDDER